VISGTATVLQDYLIHNVDKMEKPCITTEVLIEGTVLLTWEK
jgi:hypothetical protein